MLTVEKDVGLIHDMNAFLLLSIDMMLFDVNRIRRTNYLKGVRGVFEIVLAIAWYHVTFKIKLLRNCTCAKFTLIY